MVDGVCIILPLWWQNLKNYDNMVNIIVATGFMIRENGMVKIVVLNDNRVVNSTCKSEHKIGGKDGKERLNN